VIGTVVLHAIRPYSLQYRNILREITRRVVRLYEETDMQAANANCITQLFAWLRETISQLTTTSPRDHLLRALYDAGRNMPLS